MQHIYNEANADRNSPDFIQYNHRNKKISFLDPWTSDNSKTNTILNNASSNEDRTTKLLVSSWAKKKNCPYMQRVNMFYIEVLF